MPADEVLASLASTSSVGMSYIQRPGATDQGSDNEGNAQDADESTIGHATTSKTTRPQQEFWRRQTSACFAIISFSSTRPAFEIRETNALVRSSGR